jgi:nucleotide-binding universal stress UspA family protein
MLPEPKVDRILFATDFLASSRVALDYAVAFANHFKAALILLHAVELPYPAREAEAESSRPSVSRRLACERLDAIANGVRCTGLHVETFVVDGIPSEVILRAVDYHAADLLVLGIYGVHRGLAHLLIGSNTERILLAANCPTMTVGAHVMAGVDPGLHFKEILYFSDFTSEAAVAAPYAVFLAKEFHAPIDLCQLMPDVADDSPHVRSVLAENYCESMKKLFPDANSTWCSPAFQLEHGMEIDEIIERAQSQSAGLIVLGSHTESQLGRHLHTSFAYHLLAKATCPVISIRRQGSGGL